MKVTQSYLEKGWGDSIDEPSMEAIEVAIKETLNMDDEHCVFWVGVYDEDDKQVIFEVTKYLRQSLNLNPDIMDPAMFNIKKSIAQNWDEVIENFRLLLDGQIDKIEQRLNQT
ncbi:hypothetical protein [Sanyastnella coralliicola]|uniref:hypothetical protein n=1 Tax=Sanyastnella coralliicola TaxID=3069118 RepID=UPI0027BA7FB9|nr:hypothetical protein [Longitalea sp. SCSIO 12813]